MSKYERLTEKKESGFYKYKCTKKDKKDCLLMENCGECYGTKVLHRLGELEDKIEQGTLIELKDRKPLMWGKDGDTVHCQHCGKDLMGVFDGEAEVIQCPKCGGFVYGLVAEDYNEAILKELQE